MHDRLQTLSEREKETLRLLLGGHDAKSIARFLGLSVHTVNERLREARRKLGVTSSREAARLLADVEQHSPYLSADKKLGEAGAVVDVRRDLQLDRRPVVGPVVWLAGGMLIMSLIIASVILSSAVNGGGEVQAPATVVAATSLSTSESGGSKSARKWVALLDQQRWNESWSAAGGLFKSQLSAPRWAATVQPIREPLGPVSSRTLQGITKAATLPGLPTGEYEIIQFKTSFANRLDAIETVVLSREGTGWRVNGYFIR